MLLPFQRRGVADTLCVLCAAAGTTTRCICHINRAAPLTCCSAAMRAWLRACAALVMTAHTTVTEPDKPSTRPAHLCEQQLPCHPLCKARVVLHAAHPQQPRLPVQQLHRLLHQCVPHTLHLRPLERAAAGCDVQQELCVVVHRHFMAGRAGACTGGGCSGLQGSCQRMLLLQGAATHRTPSVSSCNAVAWHCCGSTDVIQRTAG